MKIILFIFTVIFILSTIALIGELIAWYRDKDDEHSDICWNFRFAQLKEREGKRE